jgi:glycosyltransferase involved in cell wall biosynthesis
VAIDGPGVRDSVRDGIDGVVVAADPLPSRAARVGDAIADLAADETRRGAMARRARDDADRFAIEERVQEVERLYRSLLG